MMAEDVRRLVIKILEDWPQERGGMPQVEVKRCVMEAGGKDRPTDRRLRKILQKMDRDHLIVRVPKGGTYELHLPGKEIREKPKAEKKEKVKEKPKAEKKEKVKEKPKAEKKEKVKEEEEEEEEEEPPEEETRTYAEFNPLSLYHRVYPLT